MHLMRRVIAAATALGCLCLVTMSVVPSVAAAACPTANPAANFTGKYPGVGPFGEGETVAQVQELFNAARTAEGCTTPMVLPANYATMTRAEQFLALYNSEREARGLPALKLDSTLMGRIAFNHSNEITTYGYAAHASPIDQPQAFSARISVNPVFTGSTFGENGAWSTGGGGCANEQGEPTECPPGLLTLPSANIVFTYMYGDGPGENANPACKGTVTWGCWGHRQAILGTWNWVAIGVAGAHEEQVTSDFGNLPASYTPPATADTNPPVLGPVTYANGTATVTGVADSPMNMNDTGATPLTKAISDVVFYTNAIKETTPGSETFNTVVATESAAGTWTAPITVAAGEVLHAVAVDGSGNFTDATMAPPATTLTAGENTVAIPAATPAATTARLAAVDSGSNVPAATPTAAALVASIDKQAHRKVVRYVKVYVSGHWRTYRPGKSKNFPLYTSEGVDVALGKKTKWRAPAGDEPLAAPTIKLHKGWNFVAAPYPLVHMTCHATRFELAGKGDRLEEISVGTKPNTGMIMKPMHGKWGNDLMMVIDDGKGFWVKDAGSATWTPSPTLYIRGKRTTGTPTTR